MDEKRKFLTQYVLNRALAKDSNLNAHSCAKAALEAWNFIESVSSVQQNTNGK